MLELEILDLLKRLPYRPTKAALKDMLIKNRGCSNSSYNTAIFRLMEKNEICISTGDVQFIWLPEMMMREIEKKIIELIQEKGSIKSNHLRTALIDLNYMDATIEKTLTSLQDRSIIYENQDFFYLTDITLPSEPPMEAISRETLAERERCIQIIWNNRGKCASNQAALALMNEINGRV